MIPRRSSRRFDEPAEKTRFEHSWLT